MNKKRLLMLSGLSAVLLVAIPAFAYTYENVKVTISDFEGATLTTNSGTLVIGDSASYQLGIDYNEIQARNNNSNSTLYFNQDGGLVEIGNGGLNVGSGGLLVSGGSYGIQSTAGITANAGIMTFAQYWADSMTLISSGSTMCTKVDAGTGDYFFGICSSSGRLKKNVRTIKWGLREVLSMNPVTFDWKDDGRTDVGFIAEEALGVVPELVEHDKDGAVSGFNYRHYTAVLTRAIQEQQNTIADQGVELNTTQQAIALRDKELARLGTEVTDQAAELKKLREEMSALSLAVASMSARP